MSELFRAKSMEKMTSPEELNDYIKVTTPSVWMVLVATVILLLGMLFWSIFGTINLENSDGTVQEVYPITFVTN